MEIALVSNFTAITFPNKMWCLLLLLSCSYILTTSYAMEPVIIVHGGAGDTEDSRVRGKLAGVKVAARAGYEALQGGTALDAVEAAVRAMEDDEYFDAGCGSDLNIAGEVEMEASIMSGADLNVGGVALVKDFQHPVSLARTVLTQSPHSLLGGDGATMFALEQGFETVPRESFITEYAKEALKDYLEHGDFNRHYTVNEITRSRKFESGVGTVGAVAIDSRGHIAAATSTGGLTGKAVGRMGDVPMIGSATYADDAIGGVSCTGHGESILKFCLAHTIIKLMEQGVDAQTATKNAISAMTSRLNNTAGAIALSKEGDIGFHFGSQRMAWAYMKHNKLFYGIDRDEVLEEQ